VARIAGIDLPQNKRTEIGLTYIHGIGRSRATSILAKASVNKDTKVRDLSEQEVTRIRQIIQEEGNVEGDLRRNVQQDIRRLTEIGSYRGYRHRRKLPCRGQRTHTNARAKKGPRIAIAGKRRAVGKKG
jgi:small subunit ribosomal protein S13